MDAVVVFMEGCPMLNDRRKKTYHSKGWPMKRREYEHILSIARPRAQQ